MESRDALAIIAQVAVAIAGFSSVVVAMDTRAVRTWSVFQRHSLRVLLQVSAVTLFFAIFPLILARAVEGPTAWNWALAIYGIVHVIDATSFIRGMPKHLPPLNRILPLVGLTIAVSSVLAAWLTSARVAELFYLLQLVWHLGISSMGFALLVIGDPDARVAERHA